MNKPLVSVQMGMPMEMIIIDIRASLIDLVLVKMIKVVVVDLVLVLLMCIRLT